MLSIIYLVLWKVVLYFSDPDYPPQVVTEPALITSHFIAPPLQTAIPVYWTLPVFTDDGKTIGWDLNVAWMFSSKYVIWHALYSLIYMTFTKPPTFTASDPFAD